MSKPGDWMKDPAFLANAGHVGWGAVVMLVAAVFTRLAASPWDAMLYAQATLAATIAFKEYVIDLREESNETLWSSTVDLAGWMGGSAIGWTVAALATHLRVWS